MRVSSEVGGARVGSAPKGEGMALAAANTSRFPDQPAYQVCHCVQIGLSV